MLSNLTYFNRPNFTAEVGPGLMAGNHLAILGAPHSGKLTYLQSELIPHLQRSRLLVSLADLSDDSDKPGVKLASSLPMLGHRAKVSAMQVLMSDCALFDLQLPAEPELIRGSRTPPAAVLEERISTYCCEPAARALVIHGAHFLSHERHIETVEVLRKWIESDSFIQLILSGSHSANMIDLCKRLFAASPRPVQRVCLPTLTDDFADHRADIAANLTGHITDPVMMGALRRDFRAVFDKTLRRPGIMNEITATMIRHELDTPQCAFTHWKLAAIRDGFDDINHLPGLDLLLLTTIVREGIAGGLTKPSNLSALEFVVGHPVGAMQVHGALRRLQRARLIIAHGPLGSYAVADARLPLVLDTPGLQDPPEWGRVS